MSLPRILAVVPHFIRPSEAWLHRQLQYFSRNTLRVIAYEHHHNDQLALPEAEVVPVPEQHNQPLRGWKRRLDKIVAREQGGLRFGSQHRSWLRSQVSSFKPDLVHCQYGTFGLSTLYAVRTLGVPVFVQFNGHDLTSYIQRKRPRTQMVAALNHFQGLVSIADYQQEWLLTNGADPERVAMIPYGAPQESSTASGHDRNACRFIAVGRLCEMKAPLHLIRAFAKCKQQSTRASLTIIGDGDLRSESESLIRELGLQSCVTIMGFQSPEVVRNEMLSSDVFVQHSVTANDGMKEGWPVAIGEAMNRGLPILSTRHAGIIQQVREGANGHLCDEHDWQKMGDHMTSLANNRDQRIRMGQKSRSFALDSTDQAARQLEFMMDRCGIAFPRCAQAA